MFELILLEHSNELGLFLQNCPDIEFEILDFVDIFSSESIS